MTRTIRVTHPSGEVSTRRTEADYTHAVVAVIARADEIAWLRKHTAMLEAEGHRAARLYRKELERTEANDHPLAYSVVSMHTRRDLAERRARDGHGWIVVPVDREETR